MKSAWFVQSSIAKMKVSEKSLFTSSIMFWTSGLLSSKVLSMRSDRSLSLAISYKVDRLKIAVLILRDHIPAVPPYGNFPVSQLLKLRTLCRASIFLSENTLRFYWNAKFFIELEFHSISIVRKVPVRRDLEMLTSLVSMFWWFSSSI